ncbi:uncharacterized protein METZ01_LOCUS332774, partial [marine metagenome]
MKILITGAEGFVGRNLFELFKKNKYDILSPTVSELDLTISRNVSDYFRNNRVDIIVHSATTLRTGTSYPDDACERNLRMFFNLLKELTPSMKLINLSSGSDYSREHWHKKMPEDFFGSHIPKDGHSFSKYLISKYIEEAQDSNMVTLRIFGIFGRYEDYRYKFISNTIAKNLLKLPIIINQNAIYDYLYINDFYQVVEFFVKNNAKYKTYNVTPSEPIDLLSVAKLVNSSGNFQSDIRLMNKGIGVDYTGDNSRLLSEVKDFKVTSYADAIAKLYDYYKGNISILDKEALKKDEFLNHAKNLRKISNPND